MTTEEINRVVHTLENGERSFYVYALSKEGEGTPFYIGKGRADRIEAHRRDAMEILKDLKASRSLMTVEEVESEKAALSRKIQAIIESKCAITHVIVKWGLTEDEAFMCESALINMLKFIKVDLTNIANGHASDPEKKCRADNKTQALTLDQFLAECAVEQKPIEDLKGLRIILISINKFYPKCCGEDGIVDAEKIKESVCAFWKVAIKKARQADYVMALYRQKVVGVFRVKTALTIAEFREGGFNGFPLFPPEDRRLDRLKCSAPTLLEAKRTLSKEEYKDLVVSFEKDEKEDADRAMENFQKRVIFRLDENVPENVGAYMNCVLTENGTTEFLTKGRALFGGPILQGF